MPDRRQFKPADFRKTPAIEADRASLSVVDGCDLECSGFFTRLDRIWIHGVNVPANLIQRIESGGRVITDHAWFTDGAGWQEMALTAGEEIAFVARVGRYVKGREGEKRSDFRLFYPRRVRRVIRSSLQQSLKL